MSTQVSAIDIGDWERTEWRMEATRVREDALGGLLAPGSRCWCVSRYCRVSSDSDVTEE